MKLCLGKRTARIGAVRLKFNEIFQASELPAPPTKFGHYGLVPEWRMFANDMIGNCVLAGAAHEHTLWRAEGGGDKVEFTSCCVIDDYSSITGFVIGHPDTDNGTDMELAAKYRRKIGVRDASGARHRIAAYTALRRGDVDQLALASYLTGAVGVGLQITVASEYQFKSGTPWEIAGGDRIVGGHYVPVVGRLSNGNFLVVTWGKLHEMTPEFYERYNDESIAYLSPDIIRPDKLSPEGFDLERLVSFLKGLSS